MPSYTYDDFISAANQAGLLQEFSQADLDTAQRYPEFGMSILGLKQDIHKATTPEAKLLANEAANQLRSSYGGYTGGPKGADYVSVGKIPNQIDSVLDRINSFGSFDFGREAPTYTNQYAEQQQALLDAILNREDFSWSKDTDPLYGQYRKSYLREGDRATADALGQAAAASGGRPSTAAVTAATQAGDYYAAQLNDIIPTLYQQAYDQYLDEYNMSLQDLNAVNTQEQLDYAKYLDDLTQFNTDRNFAFNEYLSDFDILQSQLAALQGQDESDYGRWMDKVTLGREDQQQRQQLAQGQVDAILSAGGTPSADLVSQAGYSSEYVQALEDAYRQQAAARVSSGSGSRSGGGSSGSSGGSGTTTSGNDAVERFNSGDYSDAVIAALLNQGYTQADIEAAGYNGNYFDRNGSSGSSMNQDHYRAFGQSISAQLSAGRVNAALGNIESRWNEMSTEQRQGIQNLLERYGYTYET